MAGFAARLKQTYGHAQTDNLARDTAKLIDTLAQKLSLNGKVVNDSVNAPDLTLVGNQGATSTRRGQDGGLQRSMQLVRPLVDVPVSEGNVSTRQTIRAEMQVTAMPCVILGAWSGGYTVFPLQGPVPTVTDNSGLPGVTSMYALMAAVMANPAAYASQGVNAVLVGDATPAVTNGEIANNLYKFDTYKVVAHFQSDAGDQTDQTAVKTLIRTEWIIVRNCCGQVPNPPDPPPDPPPG